MLDHGLFLTCHQPAAGGYAEPLSNECGKSGTEIPFHFLRQAGPGALPALFANQAMTLMFGNVELDVGQLDDLMPLAITDGFRLLQLARQDRSEVLAFWGKYVLDLIHSFAGNQRAMGLLGARAARPAGVGSSSCGTVDGARAYFHLVEF